MPRRRRYVAVVKGSDAVELSQAWILCSHARTSPTGSNHAIECISSKSTFTKRDRITSHSIISTKVVVASGAVTSLAATTITRPLADTPAAGPMNTTTVSAKTRQPATLIKKHRRRLAKTLSQFEAIAWANGGNNSARTPGNQEITE